MMVKKRRRRGYMYLSRENQKVIPAEAGLKAGDELGVEAPGLGRVVLGRADDPIERFAGCLDGIFPPDYLRELRDEWRK